MPVALLPLDSQGSVISHDQRKVLEYTVRSSRDEKVVRRIVGKPQKFERVLEGSEIADDGMRKTLQQTVSLSSQVGELESRDVVRG